MKLYHFEGVRHRYGHSDVFVMANSLVHARAILILHPMMDNNSELQVEVSQIEAKAVYDPPVAIFVGENNGE